MKIIILLTIVVAVVLYLIQYKLGDLIEGSGKKWITSLVVDEWKGKLADVKQSPERDSLDSLLNELVDRVDMDSNFIEVKAEGIINTIDSALKDSLISQDELSTIRNLIEGNK